MKKFCVFLLIITLCSSFNFAQSKKAVSILGNSYSTFEGYLQPDTNSIWYGIMPFQDIRLTLSLYVKLGGIN